MQLDNYYVFFKAKKEWVAMVTTITPPPKIVSKLGCSLTTSHTHKGPNIVSKISEDLNDIFKYYFTV